MVKKLTYALIALTLFEAVSLTQTQTAMAAYAVKPGDVIKANASATVYYVDDQLQRIPMYADAFAVRYNNDFSKVKNLTTAEVGSVNNDLILNREMSEAEGSLIMYDVGQTVYLIENGMKRPFTSWQAFINRGYSGSQIKWVGTYHLYATGPVIN
ncbi:MAG: hypothetical protein HY545_02625 [Candidatus Doudnabacteria bacterium]|nr:hypothetical protein [Candidatus Doudnabacteria bacterium]